MWPDFKLGKSMVFCTSAHPCSHSSVPKQASLKAVLYLITNTGLYICKDTSRYIYFMFTNRFVYTLKTRF